MFFYFFALKRPYRDLLADNTNRLKEVLIEKTFSIS